jgi:hypothetical protein
MFRRLYTVILFTIAFCSSQIATAQCNTPTLSVFDIVADSATVSWIPVGAVLNYEYAILPATSPQPTTGTPTISTSVRVGGLMPGTGYKAWLKANCTSTIASAWGSITFSTTPCGTPSTINIAGVSGDSADISWTSVSPGANYQYYIDTLSTTPSTGTNISTNSVRVKGLLPAKTYYVFVRTFCGGSSYSAWSASQSFFTPFPVGINNIAPSMAIAVYPNPVTYILTIHTSDNNTTGNITIYNAVGKAITTFSIGNSPLQFDMSGYPAGMYLLKYNHASGTGLTKILKR